MRVFRTASAAAAARLVASLDALRMRVAEDNAAPGTFAAMQRLRAWQAARLAATYADLASQSRYQGAIAFFQSDLYGPGDFSRRDADLARVVPVLVRMLPASVIDVVADAVDLNALSHRLDHATVAHLASAATWSVAQYAAAFRNAGHVAERTRQIDLIGVLGRAIDHYSGKRAIRGALALMRAPARAAGLGELQDFLERGFASFRRMRGADEFLAIVDARERAILDAILGGSAAPFADPLAVR